MERTLRISILLALVTILFLTQLSLGYISHSLALLADAFHMLSDCLSLIVALYAIRLSSLQSQGRWTYGWKRAEVVGALINGVFLIALCFTIVCDAIGRLIEPEIIEHPQLILVVGCIGLAVNLFGMWLFHEHAHIRDYRLVADEESNDEEMPLGTEEQLEFLKGHLNMHGVFLHVLGDAFASLGVIGSSLFIWLTDYPWRYYVDPITSLFITCVVLYSCIPLVSRSASILLQSAPIEIPLDRIQREMEKNPLIKDIHDFHVWQLSDTLIVASVHLVLVSMSNDDYMQLLIDLKAMMSRYGVNDVTVQPEFHPLCLGQCE